MSAHAELSSLSTVLNELNGRLSKLIESLTGPESETLSADLYEVERNLGAASRRLGTVVRRAEEL